MPKSFSTAISTQTLLYVQLHYHFASRFPIETLNSLGFSASYNHMQQLNQSTAVYEGTNIPEFNGQSVQYAADNVQHTICTLVGKHTFHGIEIVAAVTLFTKHTRCVPRRKVTTRELTEVGKIKVHHCKGASLKKFVNSEYFR